MAEEDLMTEDYVDEAPRSKGINIDRVRKRVELHFESERNANRRRGQQVFNELIAKGTPYADALREAGNAGLFYDNAPGQIQALQHVAEMEARKERPIPQRVINVRGQAFRVPPQGALEPMMDAPIPPVKPAPIVATRQDPITGANLRMNADQLSQEQIKSTLKKRSEMEPTMGPPSKQIAGIPIPFTGSPTYDPAALEKNTQQLKGLRLGRESSIPKMPAAPSAPSGSNSIVRPLPKNKNELIPGTPYQTRKGPAIWNGEAFEQ